MMVVTSALSDAPCQIKLCHTIAVASTLMNDVVQPTATLSVYSCPHVDDSEHIKAFVWQDQGNTPEDERLGKPDVISLDTILHRVL